MAIQAPPCCKTSSKNITYIADFIWKFCANYIPLDSVTKIIAMPIPRCNSSVTHSLGEPRWRWLVDAISGYNQINVAKSSQEKMSFAGTNCTKYTLCVMPFGLFDGPVVLIVFAHDMGTIWKELAVPRVLSLTPKLVPGLLLMVFSAGHLHLPTS